MKIHKKLFLSVASVLVATITTLTAIAISLSTAPADAAGPITVAFSASPTSPTVGANVTVVADVSVPSSENPMAAIKLRFQYDTNYLEFQSQSSSGTAFDACTYANNLNTDFLPQFTCSSTSGSLRTGKVASVVFKVLQPGTTSVTGVPIVNMATDSIASPYTVNFTPVTIGATAPSTDANLANLTVSTGTLSPAFSPSTTSYSVSVPNSTSSITITATPPTGGSKSGDGAKTLSVGANTYPIVSTAQDGTTTKTYTVVVTRQAASSNNNLSGLSVSGYSISPAFDPSVTAYTLTVPNAAGTVTVNATTQDSGASTTGTGSKVLAVGSNSLVIEVTAADGSKKTYTINVIRESGTPLALDSDSSLKSLSVSGYTLSPTFGPGKTSYTMSVPNSVTSLGVTAVPNSSKATVAVSGNTNWKPGVNNITVTVTAEDGSKTIYSVAVTRAGSTDVPSTSKPSSDNTLSSIKESTGLNLFSNFNSGKASYDISVPYEIDKLGLIATPSSPKAKVEIIGDNNFKVGMNTVTIKVTAEDGSEKYYTVNVTRSAASGELGQLDISNSDTPLSPNFDPSIRHYEASVGYDVDCLNINAIPLNSSSKVTIIGNCDLKPGKNVVRVRVEYEPGKFADYYIEVDKAHPPTILGLAPWLFWTLLGLFLFLLFIIILLAVRRRKKQAAVMVPPQNTPVIEFRPEFNFGSKNNENSQNDALIGEGSMHQPTPVQVPPAQTSETSETFNDDISEADIERFLSDNEE